jgi:hypothetical protein
MNPHSPHTGTPLPPFRFSVRTLLFFVSGCGICMGLCRWLPTEYLGFLLFALLMVGAHIAGNAIGTRLRDGPEPTSKRNTSSPVRVAVEAEHFARPTNLRERASLGWVIPISSVLGALLGMSSGWYAMHVTYGQHLEWAAIVVAVIAFGILGAFGTFMIGTFTHVIWQAIHDSHREES